MRHLSLLVALLGPLLLGLLLPGLAGAQGTPAGTPHAGAQRLVALVVGNQEYRHVSKLENAAADARAMAAFLRQRGFQVFDGYDLDRSGMNRLFNRFESALSAGAVAVLYFAGHGVQVNGINVLVPVDAQPETERELIDDGIPLPALMERMAAVNGRRDGGLNLLIVDACRDNPFRAAGRSLGVTRGLAAGGASGAMVLYAAASNQRALDRLGPQDSDPNGVFTRTLLRAMQQPGLPVREMVAKVRTEVAAAARGAGTEQTPAVYDEAEGDFTFTPGAPSASANPVPPEPAPAPAPTGADREHLFWQSIMASTDARDFQAYLQNYPNGTFAPLARNRLTALQQASAGKPAAPQPAPARTFSFTNDTQAIIEKLFFGPSSRQGDSPNHVADRPMPPGRTLDVRLPAGECSYDLFFEFRGNARGAELHRGIDTCRDGSVTIR